MYRLVVLALIVSLSSCFDRKKTKALYPVDSLLNAQAKYLSRKKAMVKKVVVLDGKEEEISVTPKDSTAWRNELEIFTALDVINKPVNRVYYSIEEDSDRRSNLIVRTYATKEEDLPVKYFKIYYQYKPSRLRRLEAHFNELSSIYKSSRELTMDFQQFGDTVVLTSYSIVGGQKMMLDDSVQYRISASLKVLN
jgi:hypothetical protein